MCAGDSWLEEEASVPSLRAEVLNPDQPCLGTKLPATPSHRVPEGAGHTAQPPHPSALVCKTAHDGPVSELFREFNENHIEQCWWPGRCCVSVREIEPLFFSFTYLFLLA